MKIKSILVLTAFIGCSVLLTNCKKKIYGCTETTAENYSSVATDSDGSCITPIAPEQTVFSENFTVTWGPGVTSATYVPTFTSSIEYTDFTMVLEASGSSILNWSNLPVVTSNIVFWGEYDKWDGEITLYADYVDTGNSVAFTSSTNLEYRVTAIKR